MPKHQAALQQSQCGRQVGTYIVEVFQPHRHANQARGNPGGQFVFGAHAPVGGGPRVGDGGFYVAEIGGFRQYLHRINHLPSQLSGGEQQRVCIARALVNRPPVIFADEPTGNLDETNENLILQLLTDLNRQGHTIVMVTHNPELGKLANRTIFLQHGKFLREKKHL